MDFLLILSVEGMGNSIQLIVMWTKQECISENFMADVPSTGTCKLEWFGGKHWGQQIRWITHP